MTAVAVRLSDDLLARVDDLVSAGRFPSRSDAIRQAIEALVRADHEDAIDRAILAGYREVPETADELARARTATLVLIDEEPW